MGEHYITVNKSGDNIVSILINGSSGPKEVPGTEENEMLYIEGMCELFEDGPAVLNTEPLIAVLKQGSKYSVKLRSNVVQIPPNRSGELLKAVRRGVEDADHSGIVDICRSVLDQQVRRGVVNEAARVLPEIDMSRVEIAEKGWIIDRYYLLDWNSKIFIVEDNNKKGYRRSGSGVEEADDESEFTEIHPSEEIDNVEITVDGVKKFVGEQEVTHIGKAIWLLNRANMHRDKPFWMWMEKRRSDYLDSNL